MNFICKCRFGIFVSYLQMQPQKLWANKLREVWEKSHYFFDRNSYFPEKRKNTDFLTKQDSQTFEHILLTAHLHTERSVGKKLPIFLWVQLFPQGKGKCWLLTNKQAPTIFAIRIMIASKSKSVSEGISKFHLPFFLTKRTGTTLGNFSEFFSVRT